MQNAVTVTPPTRAHGVTTAAGQMACLNGIVKDEVGSPEEYLVPLSWTLKP